MYPCITPNTLLHIAMCFARIALLGIVSIHEIGHTYKGSTIQGKCGYPYLTPNTLLRIAACSARDTLNGIVSIYEAGHSYTGQRIQAWKCGYSEQGIRSRTCGYTELSEVRHRYLECPTPNVGTFGSLASYKILFQPLPITLYTNYNSLKHRSFQSV